MNTTWEVSKFERSSVARDEQPSNMLLMLVALEVSKDERSSVARDEQP